MSKPVPTLLPPAVSGTASAAAPPPPTAGGQNKRSHSAANTIAPDTPAKAGKAVRTASNGVGSSATDAEGARPDQQSEGDEKQPQKKTKATLSSIAHSHGRHKASTASGGAAAGPPDTNFRIVDRYRPVLHSEFIPLSASDAAAANTAAAAAATDSKHSNKSKRSNSVTAAAAASGAVGMAVSDTAVASVTGSEILMVELPWLKVMQSFPDPIYRHKYGT